MRDSTVSWLILKLFCIFIHLYVGFEPDYMISSVHSVFFLTVSQIWDSFWVARPRFRAFGEPYSQVGATMALNIVID